MSVMIERAAKAIEDALHGKEFLSYEDAARAAIEAMREPSIGMIYAATQKDCLESGAQDDAYETWQDMISAALSEEG